MQHFHPNLFISDVSQPQDTSSSGEDSDNTIDVTCRFTLTDADIQALTEQWNIKPYPTRRKMKKISKVLNLHVKCVEVNSMPNIF